MVCEWEQMLKDSLFHGRKDYRLDPKGRIPFPAVWYAPLGLESSGTVVVARGISSDEKYLEIFSNEKWEERMKLVHSFPEGKFRNKFLKWYISTAETIELDNQNRMRLSKNLIDYCSIIKDVALVGNIETVQIWSKDVLDKSETVEGADFDMVFDFMNKAKKEMTGKNE